MPAHQRGGRSERAVERYAHGLIRSRWAVLLTALAVAGAAMAGVARLQPAIDYRYHFTEEHPELVAFNHLEDTYTKFDNILYVLAPRRGDVFDGRTLDAVLWLTEQSWQLPHSIRVDSVTNYQHTWARDDDLVVEDLVEDPGHRERARRVALHEPQLANSLVSLDGRATAVNVTIRIPEVAGAEAEAALAGYRLAEALRARHPELDVAVTGSVPLTYALQQAPLRDMSTLLPAMYATLLLAMFLFLRSLFGVLALLATVALAAGSAMGIAGWLGIPVSPPMATAPTIILTIAIADGIHILVTLIKAMRAGASRDEALVASLRANWQPVFLTSLTTIVGFASLNLNGVPPLQDLGNVTAVGVFAAWFFSVTFLPAFVAVVPYRVQPARTAGGWSMERFADWVVFRRRAILPATLAVSVVCALFIPRIEIDDMFLEYFDDSVEFRRDTLFAIDRLSGVYQQHYSIESDEENGISDPAYLGMVEDYTAWLRSQPEVDHVSTITDTMKRLNKNLHGDDDAWYRLPDERALAAQYLLLYEMSLPYGLDLNNQVDIRKASTKVTATVQNMTARELRAFDERAAVWLAEHTPPSVTSSASGVAFMFANLSRRTTEGMVLGTTIAFALIALILVVSLRSVGLGILSLVPNVTPVLIAFGVWAILVGRVGIVFSVVASTSLGIIVDGTVHFLSKYLRARRVDAASPEDAVRYALSTVGSALWVSFLILVAGFAVLTLSTFTPNGQIGLLMAITIGAALLADFLLLPTLLLALDRGTRRGPG